MTKKKRTTRGGHPGRVNRLSVVGNATPADTALQHDFGVWYREHALAFDKHPQADAVQDLTGILFRTAQVLELSLSHPTIDVLDTVLDLIANDEEFSILEVPSLDVLMHYLEFLDDTENWAGTKAEFDESMGFIAYLLDSLDDEDEEINAADALSTQHPAATVLRLKIALLDSKPAIWRRVTVSADATLADLHNVIQAVFGWQNSHLHQFFEGDNWYAPDVVFTDLRFDEFFEDDIEDEAAAGLGFFFEVPGDELHYLYDFGDDWRHLIRLEKIEPEGTDAGPHCIDGRGHAPVDDSGGVFGWTAKVRVSQDPNDPDHEAIRDWLLLNPGEVLDLKAFDLADADAALAPIRRGK